MGCLFFFLSFTLFDVTATEAVDEKNIPSLHIYNQRYNVDIQSERLVKMMDLSSAINFAVSNRLELEQKQAAIQQAQSITAIEKAAFYPTVNLVGDLSRNKLIDDFTGVDVTAEFRGTTVPVTIRPDRPGYTITNSLDVNYSLYNGGEIRARYEKAKLGEKLSLLEFELTRQQAVKEIFSGYWTIIKLFEEVEIAQSDLDYNERQFQQAEKLHLTNSLSKNEEIEVHSNVLAAKNVLLEKEWQLEKAKTDYCLSLGFDDVNINSCVEQIRKEIQQLDIDQLISHWEKYSDKLFDQFVIIEVPALESLRTELERLEKDKVIDRAKSLPDLDIYAKYNLAGRADDLDDSIKDLSRSSYNIGLKLDWPLYESNKAKNLKAKNTAMILEQRAAFALLKKKISLSHNKLSKEIEFFQKQITTQKEIAKLKDQLHENALESMKKGFLTEMEYLEKKNLYLQEQSNLRQLKIALLLTTIDKRIPEIN
jgi:outer membrane protein